MVWRFLLWNKIKTLLLLGSRIFIYSLLFNPKSCFHFMAKFTRAKDTQGAFSIGWWCSCTQILIESTLIGNQNSREIEKYISFQSPFRVMIFQPLKSISAYKEVNRDNSINNFLFNTYSTQFSHQPCLAFGPSVRHWSL